MNFDHLSELIKPFDLTVAPDFSAPEQEYFRFYGINFEEKIEHVKHYFGHFDSGPFKLVAHYFQHQQATRTCFILHGYYDHSGLFGHVINYCLQRKISVVIFDLPGHGLSTGPRATIDSFEQYQHALRDLVLLFNDKSPQPWYAIGQSTGASILIDFILSGGDDIFKKAVLLAPLVKPRRWRSSQALHAVCQPFVERVTRRFAINSHDQKFLDFLKNEDPLQSKELPLQWVAALQQWIPQFIHKPPLRFSPLIIQGKQDKTVDWKFNVPLIKQKFPNAKSYYLQRGRHQLVNESEEIRAPMFTAIDLYFDVDQLEQ
ncbi:MAG: lysophospholipase [Oceanicoccus sp.]|jgi:lysophospholipase